MSNFTPYLERNQAFAASGAQADVPRIPFIPFKQLYLITCIDPCVEPAAVLGVRLGEAIVARNVGGRVLGHAHLSSHPATADIDTPGADMVGSRRPSRTGTREPPGSQAPAFGRRRPVCRPFAISSARRGHSGSRRPGVSAP